MFYSRDPRYDPVDVDALMVDALMVGVPLFGIGRLRMPKPARLKPKLLLVVAPLSQLNLRIFRCSRRASDTHRL